MTWTQTTLTIKDAAGTNQPVIAYTDGTNFSFAHPLLDNTGAIISPATQATLANVLSALQGAIPSGTNVIGKVTTDQTSHGTTDLVAADVTKIAGAAFALGQQAAGSSLPVVLTAAQLTSLTAPVLGAGNNVAGKFGIDQTTPGTSNAVQVVAALPTGTNVIGSISAAANTTGGVSTFCATGGTGNALLTNSPVAVKASAGNLYGFDFVNTGAAAAYVQIFDAATGSVTLGTTPPKMSKWVPAGGAWEEKFGTEGKIAFATAITVAATTTPTGSTAPSTGVLANIMYK